MTKATFTRSATSMTRPIASMGVAAICSKGSGDMHLDGAPSESAARVPVVSILIPAYNYVAGVVRILRPLLAERRRDLEILVHDDSNNDLVECAVAEMKAEHPYLYYVRNSPRRGAVDNWN